MTIRRVLILGCGGFIGSHLIDRLLTQTDIAVTGWDSQPRKIEGWLGRPRFSFVHRFLQDAESLALLRRQIPEHDAVINLAAICNPSQYNTQPLNVIHSNFIDTHPIVRACAEQKAWLIHYSTSEVYGRTVASYLPDNVYADPALYELGEDETPLVMGPIANQRWSYAASKQLLERYIMACHMEMGLPFTIIRPLNFLGPRIDYLPGRDGEGVPRVFACFMGALLDGAPLQVVDGGTARRTFTSIYEATDAVGRMLERPDQAQNQIFNIGNRGNEVSMLELARLMRRIFAELLGDPTRYDHPIELVSGLDFYGPGYEDCDRRVPKVDKAWARLGWRAQVPLETVLRETIQDFIERYGAPASSAAAVRLSEPV